MRNNCGTVKGVVALILLVCFVEQGFAIKCWNCRSDEDPKCADPFDNSTIPISDCKKVANLEHLPGIEATMCRKIRQKVNGVWLYVRGCAWLGEPGIQRDERFCLMRTGSYNIFMEYCTCNSKDGCNSATTSGVSSIAMIFGMLATCYSVFLMSN